MHDDERDHQRETLARLLRNPLRQYVLSRYSQGVTSPSAVAAALGARLNLVSYHTHALLRAGVLELVRTEQRRGTTEHFYRAVPDVLIEDGDWEQLPTGLRRALVRLVLDGTLREAGDALARGGMDDATAHMSRSYLDLDRRGRAELASLLRTTFTRAEEIGQASRERGVDETVPCELVIMSFERASRP
jgi:DNA-binding transcriptional ArsR family regulator